MQYISMFTHTHACKHKLLTQWSQMAWFDVKCHRGHAAWELSRRGYVSLPGLRPATPGLHRDGVLPLKALHTFSACYGQALHCFRFMCLRACLRACMSLQGFIYTYTKKYVFIYTYTNIYGWRRESSTALLSWVVFHTAQV